MCAVMYAVDERWHRTNNFTSLVRCRRLDQTGWMGAAAGCSILYNVDNLCIAQRFVPRDDDGASGGGSA